MAKDWQVSVIWKDKTGTHSATVTVCASSQSTAESFVRSAYSGEGRSVLSCVAREVSR